MRFIDEEGIQPTLRWMSREMDGNNSGIPALKRSLWQLDFLHEDGIYGLSRVELIVPQQVFTEMVTVTMWVEFARNKSDSKDSKM